MSPTDSTMEIGVAPAAPVAARAAAPTRVTRPRGRGWRVPEGTVYVGRPTLWGNPFTGTGAGHARSVILHREWLRGRIGALTLERSLRFCPAQIDAIERLRRRVIANLPRLRGRHLACWCPQTSAWCHANTLLDLANRPERHAA